MAVTAKTKLVVALGILDIARQISHAWAASERAHQQRVGFGEGLRADVVTAARDARGRLPHHLEWGLPPWRRSPTAADRMRAWAPVAVVTVLATGAVIGTARWIVRQEETNEADEVVTDSRMVSVIHTGSEAIDAGVNKVVEGGATAAVGTASAVAAGTTAVKDAAVHRAKFEIDDRVVRPVKRKVIIYGSVGVAALTAYVVIIAVLVQLIVGAIG